MGQVSPRWAFMQPFDIRANGTDDIYLHRLRIIQTPLFALYLHKIMGPDIDRELHDHPWNFIPIILRGGYVQENEDGLYSSFSAGTYRYMKAERAHRIVRLYRIPTWTLCFVGHRRRDWGFYTDHGWVNYKEFLGIQ